jgi:hypothetical protein
MLVVVVCSRDTSCAHFEKVVIPMTIIRRTKTRLFRAACDI